MARYWVSVANANYNSATAWATSSGGAPGASVPDATQDANWDASSATNCSVSAAAACLNADFTGYTKTFSNAGAWAISGNLTYGAGMNRTHTGTITFNATSGTKLLTFNGITTDSAVVFDGVGGTWQVQDTWNGLTNHGMTITNGTVDFNGKSVTFGAIISSASNVRALSMVNSTLTLTNSGGNVWNMNVTTNMSFVLTGSRIVIANTSATTATMLIGNPAPLFNDIELAGSGAGNFQIATSNGTLTAHDLILTKAGVTTTVGARVVLSGRIKMSGASKVLRNGGARQATFSYKRATWTTKLAA